MGIRVSLVIALTSLASYFYILDSLRKENLLLLERYVSERSQREQAIFLQAQDNHRLLKKALEERIRDWRKKEPDAPFDTLFARYPDGSIRDRPQDFGRTRLPCSIVTRGVVVEPDFRRRLLAAQEVVSQYGPAFHPRFTDTYVILPEGAEIVYWPEDPTWCREIRADFPLVTSDFFTLSQPERNPRRQTVWTGMFEDVPSKRWMVSVVTPLDVDGQHVATVGHDVLLDELLARTVDDHPPGGYNVIFRDDGQIIAHPAVKMGSGATVYNIQEGGAGAFAHSGSEEQWAHLRAIFERVRSRKQGQKVMELPEYDEYIAVARLKGPDWNFVTVLPASMVSSAAFHAVRYVPLFGMASLLLELAIIYWVLRRQITRPLLAFSRAATQVEAGDFQVTLEASRDDELGHVVHAFARMAQEVQRREEALRQANEGLEQRVEERTRELKEAHGRLVDSARCAGMAEVATNVLHNVGNVLNSVNTSAFVARERMEGLRIEQLGRVVGLLEDNQSDLARFLTQDERGRNVLPFLRRLEQHMRNEQRELFTLIEDVCRYTDHIAVIVQVQQRYARAPQLQEEVSLAELAEDALRINSAALTRNQVRVERSLEHLPPTMIDKHKVLMILINLISNANNALDSVPVEQRRMGVALERLGEDRVRFEVWDNGVGIAPELHRRIFQYGFTTREGSNGFGLHSSALAAQELGGELSVHSEGLGRGATFTLELPYQQVA